ncbi:leucine-rich repeat-containing protein 31-like [Antedon mediterranea]|uniref:leucine-rich repeat-containing protein 31-like n=1 Tax=Antedon mediterranea TaxID=105859 RepID=UPI003AF5F634
MFLQKKCFVKTDSEKSPKEMELIKGIDDSESSTSHQQLPSRDTMTDEHAVDEICNSVRRFCTYMRCGESLKTDQDVIKMISSLNQEEEKWKHRYRWKWIQLESSEDIGRMLAHVLITVKDEKYMLFKISESCTDDVVKGLSTECSKYMFKYSIEGFSWVESHIYISTSFLLHFLINAPRLQYLNLSETYANMNDIVSVLSQKCLVLALDNLNIGFNKLNDITGSSLGTLLAISPKLKTLDMYNCSLSGVFIDAMVKECVNRNLVLELNNLNISGNILSNIKGSVLGTLLAISPKLKTLKLHYCNLSGVIIDAMARECVNRNLVLELDNLDISENNLGDIAASSLGTLLAISPKLKTLYIYSCSLSGVIIDAMFRECVNRNLVLELDNLNISVNTLSDITGSVLGTLLAISPKLKTLNMLYCNLSGVIIDTMVKECVNRNVVLELDNLDIHGNNLSDITGSVLGTLLAISPKLKTLNMSKCHLSGVIIDAIVRECVNRNLVLELNNLKISKNVLIDITGSILGTLLAISPKLKTLKMYNCSLSGVIIDAMVRECVNRNLVLKLDHLEIRRNNLTDITGSSLTTLLTISPKLRKFGMRKCKLPNDIVQDMRQHFQSINGKFSYQ